MTSSSICRVHNFERFSSVLFLEHNNFGLCPSVPPANDEGIVLLTHVEYFAAQVVLENVEEDFNIEPDAKVNEGHVDRAWCNRPYPLIDNVIRPEDKKAENDGDRDEETGKSDAARTNPSVIPCLLRVDFLLQLNSLMVLVKLIDLSLVCGHITLLKMCPVVRRDLFLGVIDDEISVHDRLEIFIRKGCAWLSRLCEGSAEGVLDSAEVEFAGRDHNSKLIVRSLTRLWILSCFVVLRQHIFALF